MTETQARIEVICESMKVLLIEKNKRYGDSALNPLRIFSNVSQDEALRVRLDDKISRIKNSNELRKNDIADLIGYLVLLSASKNWTNYQEFID